MNTSRSPKRHHALTLIEVLVIVAIVMILAALLLPALFHAKSKALGITCTNNLKVIGLSCRIWSGDQTSRFPMQLSATNGGTMEFTTGPNAFRHFQVMSNELSNPKILLCPDETDRNRITATNFNINNSNISFFVGVSANETIPGTLLAGDRNLTNGLPLKNAVMELATNQWPGWTKELHKRYGNLCQSDGSVLRAYPSNFPALLANSGLATNHLQMPILNP